MRPLFFCILLGLAFTSSSFAGGTITWPLAPLPDGANPAAIPTPKLDWEDGFQKNVVSARKMPKIDLIFDGDSFTAFWTTTGAAAWKAHFGKLNAFDFGSWNDQTQQFLWRLQNGQIDGLHPKLIILQIGATNVGYTSETPEQIIEGIKVIIAEYKKRCPGAVILLQGIFPEDALPTSPRRVKVRSVNQTISTLADGKKVIFLDVGDKFLLPDGTLNADLVPNYAHLSSKGYEVWADAIQPTIDKLLPPATSPTADAPSPTTFAGGTITWPTPPLPAGANPAVIPAPRIDWLNMFQKNLDDSKKMPKIDLIFDGDSITDFWTTTGAAVWKAQYGNLNAFDFAIWGDQTQHLLWRLQNGQVDGFHPKLIVLLIGTNNLGLSSHTPEQIAGGIQAIIADYQKLCPGAAILLQGVFPRGAKPTDPFRTKIKAINQLISSFADSKKVLYLNIGDKFLQPDGSLSTDVMKDYLHPTPKGYQIWADAIQSTINSFFPSAPAPTAQAQPKAP